MASFKFSLAFPCQVMLFSLIPSSRTSPTCLVLSFNFVLAISLHDNLLTVRLLDQRRITALSPWDIPLSHKITVTSSSAMTHKRRPSKKSNKPDELPPTVSTGPTPHSRHDPHDKLTRRFYETLVLQHVLGSTRGDHIPRHPPDVQDEEELDGISLRRDFLDKLAFVCDYEKGGATVTAIALQQTPAAVIFWIAANEDVKSKVKPFLETILSSLERLHSKPAESIIKEAEDKVFRCAVEFGKSRIKAYLRCMKEPLAKCRKILEKSDRDSDQSKESIIYVDRMLIHPTTTKI